MRIQLCTVIIIQFVYTVLAPIGAPEGLTSTSVESRSLTVQWGMVSCQNQRGPINGYRLRYNNDNQNFIVVNIDREGSRQHMLTELTPFTRYSTEIAAVNAGGIGPYSAPLTVETLQDGETKLPIIIIMFYL